MFGMNLANFIAGQEWIFIIVIAVVLIFGAKKIPELAKTFGKENLRKVKSKVKKNLKTSKIKKQNQTNFQQFL